VPTAAAPTAAPPTTARHVVRRATPATDTSVKGRPTRRAPISSMCAVMGPRVTGSTNLQRRAPISVRMIGGACPESMWFAIEAVCERPLILTSS
jgi:hypothetical protein